MEQLNKQGRDRRDRNYCITSHTVVIGECGSEGSGGDRRQQYTAPTRRTQHPININIPVPPTDANTAMYVISLLVFV